ncbi:hypothetical protein GF354_00655 [Candidatus Peregrinibacteria bacterium]|nr:hypothetical protein [Candidatus Peregrinibacteria bacterium]
MDIINLKSENKAIEDPEFKVNHLGADREQSVNSAVADKISAKEMANMNVSGKIRISFEKFVNLIATHDYEEIYSKNIDQDVIISTDLLADLANSHQLSEENTRKVPYFFIGGIILGIIITWILLKT